MPELYEVEPCVFLVFEENRVSEARLDGETVSIAGVRYSALIVDPRKWNPASSTGHAQGRSTIKAPMPGKVVRVLVSAGDPVEAGQGLIVVEAMKMQNELKTQRAGRVTELHAKENDTVEAGTLLLVIE